MTAKGLLEPSSTPLNHLCLNYTSTFAKGIPVFRNSNFPPTPRGNFEFSILSFELPPTLPKTGAGGGKFKIQNSKFKIRNLSTV
jgi:hypothetical protein